MGFPQALIISPAITGGGTWPVDPYNGLLYSPPQLGSITPPYMQRSGYQGFGHCSPGFCFETREHVVQTPFISMYVWSECLRMILALEVLGNLPLELRIYGL